MTIQLYFNTIRNLKPKQLWFQLKYRIRNSIWKLCRHRYKLSIAGEGHYLKLFPWVLRPQSMQKSVFTFLNLEQEMSAQIDWSDNSHGLLWSYNLNYMDFLLQDGVSVEEGIRLITDFIDSFPDNQVGKDPYPISIRGVNWIKFLSLHQLSDPVIDQSLCAQYRILSKNLEYHLCGNHLLENGLSLLFGAFYFRDEKLYATARKILYKELPGQFLTDGAHFEQSPMYQLILLDRILDCVNLMQNNQFFNDKHGLLMLLTDCASGMLGWLNKIIYADGEFPHFNDSTYDIAPSTQDIFNYAGGLSVPLKKIKLRESGFRGLNNDVFEAKLFVGNIMAGYIPGHSHADTFTFELRIKGTPVVVDTGISTYEKNQRRQFERGTAAHNTVQVKDIDSSQVWGGFRMGKRAVVDVLKDADQEVRARHSGYKRFGVFHERAYRLKSDSFEIEDILSGDKPQVGTARFHFHPHIKPVIRKGVIIFSGGELSIKGAEEIHISEYLYSSGFNKLLPGSVVEVLFRENIISLFSLRPDYKS